MESVRKSLLKSEFQDIKNSLITMEFIILRMIDFDLNHRLAHEVSFIITVSVQYCIIITVLLLQYIYYYSIIV